jgi:hypothetical protein
MQPTLKQYISMWGHPHNSSPSSVQFSTFLTTLLPQISDLHHSSPSSVNSLSHSTATLSLSPCNPVSTTSSVQGATSQHSTSTERNCSTSHAYQIWQLANGRPGWKLEFKIKKEEEISDLALIVAHNWEKQYQEETAL